MHDKKNNKHNWGIKSRTKTKEEKGAGIQILIGIKKNYKFYMKNAPSPLKKKYKLIIQKKNSINLHLHFYRTELNAS